MAGGLLALLDDVAAIAKVAAASVDDVIGQAAKAGTKVAGVVIDDAAVTPSYAQGFAPERELPIVWKIAKGSIFNKVVILLPAALLLSAFAPWLIPPLLMAGGLYLSYEGAEKIWHWLNPPADHARPIDEEVQDAAHLEETKVKGAIKTDFILSGEIMTIALSALDTDSIWFEGAALLIIGLAVTAFVYGSVALIVKADDVGLHMAAESRTGMGRAIGRGVVRGMPGFLKGLMILGTAAMLWVGGSIITHGLDQMGWHAPEDFVHGIAHAAAGLGGAVEWLIAAALHGVLGFALGSVLIPIVHRIVQPLLRAVGVGGAETH